MDECFHLSIYSEQRISNRGFLFKLRTVINVNKEVHMITDTLTNTLDLIEQNQKDYSTAYDCIEAELNCLKDHISIVLKYLDPLTVDDLNISLPKTLKEAKRSMYLYR